MQYSPCKPLAHRYTVSSIMTILMTAHLQPLPFDQWRLLRSRLEWFYEGDVGEKHLHFTDVVHDVAIAWRICHGSVRVRCDHDTACAVADQWIFLPRGRIRCDISAGARIVSVRFKVHWITRRHLFDHEQAIVVDCAETKRLELATQNFLSLAQTHFPRTLTRLSQQSVSLSAGFLAHSRFNLWLSAYVDAMLASGQQPHIQGKLDERILQILHFLEDTPLHNRSCEKELAHRTGMALNPFKHLFREQVGISPKRFLDERRLEEMFSRLNEYDIPIKDVAAGAGFSSLAGLTKWFRKQQGLSPVDYRETFQSV